MRYFVMLSRNIIFVVIAAMVQCFGFPVLAIELNQSARSDIWDNPFMVLAYNAKTKITTGYLAALRIAPGRTDECKLIFARYANYKSEFSVRFIGETRSSYSADRIGTRVTLFTDGNIPYLKFPKKSLEGDCDWILSFVVETNLSENSDAVMVEINVQNAGDWISVYVINAQKSRLHTRPDSSSARKAYLVKGDVVYVYDEQPGWYYVRYGEGKTKTEGWLKKSDTLQP